MNPSAERLVESLNNCSYRYIHANIHSYRLDKVHRIFTTESRSIQLKQVSIMSQRVKFTASDDLLLRRLVEVHGTCSWTVIADKFSDRSPRQCRDRWKHYLAPGTNIEEWTTEEDAILIEKVREFGKRWAQIGRYFPARPPTAIRNRCCKLSRQKNADPMLRVILSAPEFPGYQAHPPPSPPVCPVQTQIPQQRLPSIESLMVQLPEKTGQMGKSFPVQAIGWF